MSRTLDRRQFLQATGASALFGAFGTKVGAITGPRPAPDRLRVAVLNEPGFPVADAPAGAIDALARGLEGMETTWLRAQDLGGTLTPERFDVLVTPCGSAFPKEIWPVLVRWLEAAGHWVNLGGVPCAVPVERDANGGGWRVLPRDDTYSRQLGIVLACAVPTDAVRNWSANEALPWAAPLAADVTAPNVWEPYWRFSSVADRPDEPGSSGAREATVQALVTGLDARGTAVVAPYLLVSRLEGRFAGGRWVFAAGDGPVPAPAIHALVEAAGAPDWELTVWPSSACFREGEPRSVAVALRGFPRGAAARISATCALEISDARGEVQDTAEVTVSGTEASATGTADVGDRLEPGMYRIRATLTAPGKPPVELRHSTGFWVWDDDLLAAGAPLVPGPHAFTRGGEPYPVTGTTYMASDVHRKFLQQPDPWLWDRDFDAMKAAGVNLVRTGIWTGWKLLMRRVGEHDEGALRALDAWILTARRHDVPVIFTLFAFLPETWGGENPYLDPAAVEAQRAFVTLIARRYARMNDLVWDLINEPSFCNNSHLWSCRPNYDRFERAAWAAWLAQRRLPAADLPPLEDFAEGDAAPAHPTMVLEYRLFAQAMFARWVRTMRSALRDAGAGRQLVTVGQDEAGTRDSPNNLLLAPALDFSCNHTWWLNDALAWDGVITKAPGRANLVEETGVMFAAHPPGAELRWEAYARDLLERKMAMALGPGGAGFVEWVWNSNCYMPSDNEAAIGLLRADGTAKPELEALRGVAAFAAAAQPHLAGWEAERVLLVVPHSNMFSTQNTATDATRRAVRAMLYGCRMGLAAVSELATSSAPGAAHLVLVPSPRVLRAPAWASLRAWARRGVTVLVTGPLDQAEQLGRKVRRREGPPAAAVVRLRVGRGAILWCPEPVELAPDPAATVELYGWALRQARLAPTFTVEGADDATLVHAARYGDADLYTIVAERSAVSVRVRPVDSRAVLEVAVPAGRAALRLVSRRGGAVIASYDPA
ncbi:MAG TPA: cellulase family glycosylhydrolase [Gemmatimonadales bacterium]|nr:cellulase family glycosylhydrolase [Gemmatimonadales bacterium]